MIEKFRDRVARCVDLRANFNTSRYSPSPSIGARICYTGRMNATDLLARIAAEPGKMGGDPAIRGRRITPSMVLTMLATGASREAVLEAYPVLEAADIDACLLYAARLSDVAAEEGLTIAAQ